LFSRQIWEICKLSHAMIVFILYVVYKSCSKLLEVVAVQFWWHLALWFRNWACFKKCPVIVCSLFAQNRFWECLIFDLVNLWIRFWYLKIKCRKFQKLSKMYSWMFMGVIELQLWIFLVAAVNMSELLKFLGTCYVY
jgi:hypothetical protein